MQEFLIILGLAGLAGGLWYMIARRRQGSDDRQWASPQRSFSPQEERQHGYVRHALAFAKAKQDALVAKEREQTAWRQTYGQARVAELDLLSGVQFEYFLAGLFRTHGYATEFTPVTGDYGADLVLVKDAQRIAVQAKRHAGTVGVQAVQEALAGREYYGCQAAWVVTTGAFTNNAVYLAEKSGVRLTLALMRIDPGLLIFSDPLGVAGKSTTGLQWQNLDPAQSTCCALPCETVFRFSTVGARNRWVNVSEQKPGPFT